MSSQKPYTICINGYRIRIAKELQSVVNQEGVAEESEKNPFTNALGRALYRDLSKQPKLSPQQVQRNKERWAQRQAEKNKEQGVAEDSDPCWDNYKQIGMKEKNGKKVPNCVPVKESAILKGLK